MHRSHGRDYWREIPTGIREPAGKPTRNSDGSARLSTLVDVIEASIALVRLRSSEMRAAPSPFAEFQSPGSVNRRLEHFGAALHGLPLVTCAMQALRTLREPLRSARDGAKRQWYDVERKLNERYTVWLQTAQETLAVPELTDLPHLKSSAAWMTPAEFEIAREAGCAPEVDPFALTEESRSIVEPCLLALRSRVATHIAETFRNGVDASSRGLTPSATKLDRWTRFNELADAIDATKQRKFGLAVTGASKFEPRTSMMARVSPPKCIFGTLRICEPSDPACAMTFELPDRQTTERLRDHIARLRAFSCDRLNLVHRLGRECQHVQWNSAAIGWSTSGRIVWAGRPAYDEGPDIAESLQRSGFRSVWFDADVLAAGS
ncbi:MAG: hypothetical protein ACKO3W_11375 [bacterium]